jgi:YHS domain-containing protein
MTLRIILIGILIYLLFKVTSLAIRTFKAQAFEGQDQKPLSDRKVSEMVRDPVCGVYIAPNEALSVVDKGRTVHFCSSECRQQYMSDHQA